MKVNSKFFFTIAGLFGLLVDVNRRLKLVEAKMSDLQSAEQNVEDREAALEQRVQNHEKLLQQTQATLQTVNAELAAKLGGQDVTVQRLNALASRLDSFDPDAQTSDTSSGAGTSGSADTSGGTAATPPTDTGPASSGAVDGSAAPPTDTGSVDNSGGVPPV